MHLRLRYQIPSHPASYPMGTEDYYSGDKAAEAWSLPVTSI